MHVYDDENIAVIINAEFVHEGFHQIRSTCSFGFLIHSDSSPPHTPLVAAPLARRADGMLRHTTNTSCIRWCCGAHVCVVYPHSFVVSNGK